MLRRPGDSVRWAAWACACGMLSCGAEVTCGEAMRSDGSRCVPLHAASGDAGPAGAGGSDGAPDEEEPPIPDASTEPADAPDAPPVVDVAPPSFAGITSAETAPAASVRVSWERANDDLTPPGAIVYRIYWSEEPSGAGVLAATTGPGDTSAVVALPAPETTYFFRVVAVDTTGNTDENTVWLPGTSGADTVPPVFAGCTALENPGATAVHVNWAPAVDDHTATEDIVYDIYVFDEPVTASTVFDTPYATFDGSTFTTRLEGLLQATGYHVVCRATDGDGNQDQNRAALRFTTLRDDTAPIFGGLTGLTLGLTEATLSWESAADDVTYTDDLYYEVYVATTSGGHDFAAPYTSTAPGVTSVVLDVPSNSELFFVVRAVDEAGNRDDNVVELSGTTPASFALDVQPIFSRACAVTTCHVAPVPPAGLDLAEGSAYASIIDRVATQGADIGEPEIELVDSQSAAPGDSYLYRKIDPSAGTIFGAVMPSIGSLSLTAEEIEAIATWIAQGAENN